MKNLNKKLNVLHVCLLAAGRKCTVVGGGKVALRKTLLLLDSNAQVTVISPELHNDLQDLANNGNITHIARAFIETDIDNNFLVFAATNDVATNKKVLEYSKKAGIYACSIDKTWIDGDFVTPASFRHGDLSIAVSTGGKSCRRSKMIKESILRHIELMDSAEILVIGTSHNYLSINARESFHLTGKKLEDVADMLKQVSGIHEFAILNTCNRIELLAVVSNSSSTEKIIKRILQFDKLEQSQFYIKHGYDAFAHLSVVIAGLLSQTPGENHIVGQVKNAISEAVTNGWASGMIQQWLSSALHVSKNIRNSTSPILHNQEIEDLCLKYLKSEIIDWSSARVMVIGTGIIGKNIVNYLLAEKHKTVWCYHRNIPELSENKKAFITLCDINEMKEKISNVDVVICATSSDGHVIHMGHTPFFDQTRRTVIIDLAMPRNVSSDINGIAGVIKVIDLDDLKHWYRRECADMARILEISKEIIKQHQDMYEKLTESFQGRNQK